MARKKSYTTFVNPISVAVLLVALLGAVGFICWQNFVDTPVAYNESIELETSNSTVATKPVLRQLTLEKWGVSVPLKSNSYYYQPGEYTSVNSNDSVYILSTKSLRYACGTDKATIGSIERVLNSKENKAKTTASHVGATQVLGDYLYIFSRPKTACSDSLDVITLQENATSEFQDLLKDLTEK